MVKVCAESLTQWQTIISIRQKSNTLRTRRINIQSGIFQGDPSSLLFCKAKYPLSNLLNKKKGLGYQLRNPDDPINHAIVSTRLIKRFVSDITTLQNFSSSINNVMLASINNLNFILNAQCFSIKANSFKLVHLIHLLVCDKCITTIHK